VLNLASVLGAAQWAADISRQDPSVRLRSVVRKAPERPCACGCPPVGFSVPRYFSLSDPVRLVFALKEIPDLVHFRRLPDEN
jgi:hypothetical protein